MIDHIRKASVAASVAVAIGLAACGGGGGDGEGAARDGDGSATTTEAPETTSTTDASGTTAPGGPASGSGVPGDVATQLGVDRTFTGDGSEEFCAQVRALQESVSGSDPSRIDEATVTGQMAALAPPAEIADDWSLMVSVQQAIVGSQSEDPLADVDQAQLDDYGRSSAVIAAYLGDVCQLSLAG